MKILNCESVETTLASLADIYGASEDAIVSALGEIQYSEEVSRTLPWDEHLFVEFEKSMGCQGQGDRTIWFHLTRCKVGERFEEGILPLNLALPKVTALLEEMEERAVAKGQVLPSPTVPNQNSAVLFSTKTTNGIHWGPYAMLIRETAFVAREAGNHDYLSVPEIVEDICYMESRRVDLKTVYLTETKPCIVKFVQNELVSNSIRAALCYLQRKLGGLELHMSCNTCFDAKGSTVPFERILNIEFMNS